MDANSTTVGIGSLSYPVRILHGASVILAAILGIAGNLLVIVAIATTPKLRTSHNAFVVNLSLVDLLLSVCTMPFYVTAILAEGWPLSPAVCRLKVEMSITLWQVSVLTLAAVATNRYFLVAKTAETYSRFCGRKQIAFAMLFVWFVALAMSAVSELVVKVDIKYLLVFSSCVLNPWDVPTRRFTTALICLVVVTVMVILPVQYFRVLLAVRASRQRLGPAVVLELSAAGQQPPYQDCPGPPIPAGITKDEIRLIKMFLLLTLVFVISYLPVCIVYVFGVDYPVLFRGARFGMFILSIAPAINPIVYAWMNRNIRTACYRLMRCKRSAST